MTKQVLHTEIHAKLYYHPQDKPIQRRFHFWH